MCSRVVVVCVVVSQLRDLYALIKMADLSRCVNERCPRCTHSQETALSLEGWTEEVLGRGQLAYKILRAFKSEPEVKTSESVKSR